MQKLLWRELRGLLLIAAAFLLGLSLLSYHPTDASLTSASTASAVRNLAGWVGASVADGLFQLIGISAYLLPVLIGMSGWRWFWTPAAPLSLARTSGWVLLTVTLMPLASILLPALPLLADRPLVDGRAGGWLGVLIATGLHTALGPIGGVIVLFTLLAASLMLITAVSVPTLLAAMAHTARELTAQVQSLALIRREQTKRWRHEAQVRAARLATGASEQPKIVENTPPPSAVKAEQKAFEFMQTSSTRYQLPPFTLLADPSASSRKTTREELLVNSQLLEKRLLDFGITGRITQVHPGPVITMYEFEPAPGVKLNRITGLADDLALAMKAIRVRIVAPLPGKSTVGIEIPNSAREEVTLKEILTSSAHEASRSKLTLAVGKDTIGAPVVADLAAMPHLLIAGTTGSGKSMALNAMILSLLFSARPDEVKLLMIDPKMLELNAYDGIPHLLAPVIVNPKEAASALQQVVTEMQRRYRLLAERGTRNIDSYNKSLETAGGINAARVSPPSADADSTDADAAAQAEPPPTADSPLPYIVVVIDELADLMLVASHEVEDAIARLAQMARAAGIHLIVATQRPSVDVITGVIKANFSARVSFQVSSKVDSRTILDANGAEQLVGKGDMLFMMPGGSVLHRFHGAYISEQEIKTVVDFIKQQAAPNYTLQLASASSADQGDTAERDALYTQAIDLVLTTGQASASFIQRRLRVGYPRAARMIEMMEEDGLVGPASGSRPRQVLGRRSPPSLAQPAE
ncbi:MAG TPA: DNA translocase FtsK [Nitrospiria bacterium]|nr:DNA translocase FtsK [Nitrospiria bacterium]